MSQPHPRWGKIVVAPEAIAWLVDRAATGERKYGTPLMTHNGRSATQDALEEAADLFFYLFQKYLEEQG